MCERQSLPWYNSGESVQSAALAFVIYSDRESELQPVLLANSVDYQADLDACNPNNPYLPKGKTLTFHSRTIWQQDALHWLSNSPANGNVLSGRGQKAGKGKLKIARQSIDFGNLGKHSAILCSRVVVVLLS